MDELYSPLGENLRVNLGPISSHYTVENSCIRSEPLPHNGSSSSFREDYTQLYIKVSKIHYVSLFISVSLMGCTVDEFRSIVPDLLQPQTLKNNGFIRDLQSYVMYYFSR